MRVQHETVTSPDKRKRAQRKFAIRSGIIFSVLFIVTGLFLYGAHSERVRVAQIYIQGEKVTSEEEIEALVRAQLAGSYLWVLPRDVAFLYPRENIAQSILETFKRVSAVDVRFVGLQEVSVIVTEREPYALWCGDHLYALERDSSVACYFMDGAGFIFAKAPHFSKNVFPEFYGELRGDTQESPIGKTFLETFNFQNVTAFIYNLHVADIPVYMLYAGAGGVYELYIDENGSILDTGKIIFKSADDYRILLHNLIAGLTTKREEYSVQESLLPNVEYIDLRFENKVIFKFIGK